jgi:formylglycine-generating enzyme required for sulfatase activity
VRGAEPALDGEARKVGRPYTETLKGSADERSPGGLSFDMVYVPAGEFEMGSPPKDESAEASERPAHRVKVRAFWMGKREVTFDLFWRMRFELSRSAPGKWTRNGRDLGIGQNPYLTLSRGPDAWTERLGYPVGGLTQHGAQEFCEWLSARTGRTYRLPTEAEWEYAARAGTTTRYFFGDDAKRLPEYAWFGEKVDGGSHPVGRKKPNPWGLYDMYGNVAEWTLDGWSPDYKPFGGGKVSVDPWVARKDDEGFGVVRGGSWADEAERLRSAARAKQVDRKPVSAETHFEWYDSSDEGVQVGFRVVSPVEPDREEEGRPARATYIKPYGWDQHERDEARQKRK